MPRPISLCWSAYATRVSVSDDDEITRLVHSRIDDLETAITAWGKLDCAVAEAGLFPLTSSSATSTPGPC